MLIAFTVAIVTLVGQGATLPWLIGALGVRGSTSEEQQREFASLMRELRDSSVSVLNGESLRRPDGSDFDPEILEAAREVSRRRTPEEEERGLDAAPLKLQQQLELQRILVDAEQAALLDARASGAYRSATINRAQHLLDISAARFEPESGH